MKLKIILIVIMLSVLTLGIFEYYNLSHQEISSMSKPIAQKWKDFGVYKQLVPSLKNDVSINSGWWLGECIGHCFWDFTITSKKISHSDRVDGVLVTTSEKWPLIIQEYPISEKEWSDLLDLIDFEVFASLPDRIGCPGCTDAGVRWVEISISNTTKKISFESSDHIPEIADLRLKLANMSSIIKPVTRSYEACIATGNSVSQTIPRHCISDEGVQFTKTSIDTEEECIKMGFEIRQLNSAPRCISKDNQFVSWLN